MSIDYVEVLVSIVIGDSQWLTLLMFHSAWVPEESLWKYEDNRERFIPAQRVPRGLQDAVDAIEQLLKKPSASSSVSWLQVFVIFSVVMQFP